MIIGRASRKLDMSMSLICMGALLNYKVCALDGD
jgi:hypothetical protein